MSSDLLRGINAYGNVNKIDVPEFANKISNQDDNQDGNIDDSSAVNLFSDMVRNAVTSTEGNIANAEAKTGLSLVDKAPLQSTVLTVNEAKIALQMLVSIRDKVIAAYNDIIKMPI
ncbi:MAG: flagellar hook-basal body complex protein FliE [Pseudomonadota bacterium]